MDEIEIGADEGRLRMKNCCRAVVVPAVCRVGLPCRRVWWTYCALAGGAPNVAPTSSIESGGLSRESIVDCRLFLLASSF